AAPASAFLAPPPSHPAVVILVIIGIHVHGGAPLSNFHNYGFFGEGDRRAVVPDAASPAAFPGPGRIEGLGVNDSRAQKHAGKDNGADDPHQKSPSAVPTAVFLCVSGVLLWSAGATLPLAVGAAALRPRSTHSMAVDDKGASMACALHMSLRRIGKGNTLQYPH